MTVSISKAVRSLLVIAASLSLSACAATQTPQSTQAGGQPMAMHMKDCCCSKMKSGMPDGDMKGCSCCNGMDHGKGKMMCMPKPAISHAPQAE